MLRREVVERRDDVLGAIANGAITTDQIGIEVEKLDAPSREAARVTEIKEDGAASEERLDVSVEGRGVMKTKSRQELSLAAGPFEKRTNHGPCIGRAPFPLQMPVMMNSALPVAVRPSVVLTTTVAVFAPLVVKMCVVVAEVVVAVAPSPKSQV